MSMLDRVSLPPAALGIAPAAEVSAGRWRLPVNPGGGRIGNVPGPGRGQVMAYRDEDGVKRDELATARADGI